MANKRLDPGVSILMAESDPWAKASLRRIFKEFQFSNISYTDDVYKTTHQGRFEKYSLLLIGSGLDKGDSVKVVGQIRADGKNKKAPIIFMFGEGEDKEAKEAVSSGADGTLVRPVGEPELRDLMEKLLEKFILTATLEAEQNQENLSATSSGVESGQRLLALGDFDGAEGAFEEAMMTGGGSAEVFCGLAEVYLSRGDKEAAEQVLVEAERIDPLVREKFEHRNIELIKRGRKQISAGDLEGAEGTFEDALLKGGENVEAYAGLAEVHLRKGNKDAAERMIAEGEKLDPAIRERLKKLESTLVSKGNGKFDDGKLEEAKGAYECAVVTNEKSVAGNAGLGETLQAMGDEKGAAAAFQKALESDERPEDLHVYNKIGITARKSKDFDTALRSYNKALSFDRRDPILYYNKAMVYVAQANFKECLKLLENAIKYDYHFVEAREAKKKILKMMAK